VASTAAPGPPHNGVHSFMELGHRGSVPAFNAQRSLTSCSRAFLALGAQLGEKKVPLAAEACHLTGCSTDDKFNNSGLLAGPGLR